MIEYLLEVARVAIHLVGTLVLLAWIAVVPVALHRVVKEGLEFPNSENARVEFVMLVIVVYALIVAAGMYLLMPAGVWEWE